jgi:hypothetical protein
MGRVVIALAALLALAIGHTCGAATNELRVSDACQWDGFESAVQRFSRIIQVRCPPASHLAAGPAASAVLQGGDVAPPSDCRVARQLLDGDGMSAHSLHQVSKPPDTPPHPPPSTHGPSSRP